MYLHRLSSGFHALAVALFIAATNLSAHQGAHPTGLPRCEDAVVALDGFSFSGEGVVGSKNQNIFEPQNYRLVNLAAPTEIPYSVAKISLVLGDEHPGGYGDYSIRIVLPTGVHHYNGSAFPGTWPINPLIHGWSGAIMVVATNDVCGFTLQATATWNLPKPASLRNPCEPCRNLTCHAKSKIGSVDLELPIGVVQYGMEPVALRYKSDQLSNGGAAILEVEGPGAYGPIITLDPNEVVTSVECGDHLTRVTTEALPTDPNRFVIKVSSDKSDPDNTIYRETIVENVTLGGGIPALRIAETVSGSNRVRHYTQPSPNIWILEEQDLRRTTKTIVSETLTTRVTRWLIEERDAAGAWTTIETREETETNYDWGWTLTKLVADPDGKALTSEWDYYDVNEFSGPNADTAGRGRLQQEILPTGHVRDFEYLDNDPFNSGFTTVEITREAYAGIPQGLEHRRHVASNGSDLDELYETLLNGSLISKTEVHAHSAGGTHWRDELHYPSGGGAPLLTRQELDQWASNPLLQKTFYPDGTVEHIESTEAGGLKTVTIYRGVHNPGAGYPILVGQETRTVLNGVGQTISSEVCEIRNGTLYPVEMRLATQLDALNRPTTTEIFHSGKATPTFVESQSFGCCGVAAQTGQDNLTTSFYYDPLGRLRKVHRNGLSTETIFDGLVVHSHLYPEAAATSFSLATPASEAGSTIRNLAGEIVATASRAPHDGSLVTTSFNTSYNLGGGIGSRTVTTLPITPDDQGVAPTITEDFYLDGRLKQRSGAPVQDRVFSYGQTALGPTTTASLLDGVTTRQSTTTQFDWMERALTVTYSGDADGDSNPDQSSYSYDSAGRLASQTDPDGVTTLYTYDLLAETTRTAIDLNDNGTLDLDIDEVRSVRSGVTVNASSEVLSWTENLIRDVDGLGAAIDRVLSRSETSVDLRASWNHTYHGGSTSTSHFRTDYQPGQPGAWDITSTQPDGTSLLQQFRGGLLDQEFVRNADATPVTLVSRDYSYDSYQRLERLDDSGGPLVQQTYLAPFLQQPQTNTVGNRTTTYTYDARGRRTVIDEPDTTDSTGAPVDNRQLIAYWPHGAVREVTGTPGYRRSYTYDFAQRIETLTTYGTTQTTTRWDYDPDRGWLAGKRHNSPAPGAGTGDTYLYSAAGRIRQRSTPRGITTTYGRGADGRLTTTSYSDGTPSITVDQRDRLGRVTQLTDAAGTRSLSYTDLDQLDTTTWQAGSILAGWSVAQSRDSIGRLAALELNHGGATPHRIDYSYDNAGRLAAVEGNALKAHHHYHPTHQRLAQLSIVDAQRPLHFASRTYDELNRLARITYHNGNVRGSFKSHSDFHYQRDTFGRLTTTTLRDGTQWRYRYHASGELASAKRHLTETSPAVLAGHHFAWNYDGVGNRLTSTRGGNGSSTNLRTSTYASNPLNQLTSVSSPGFTDITGAAPQSPDVLVNGTMASRQGDFFRLELASNNAAGPVSLPVTVSQGASNRTGNILVPPATATPTHDLDGNQITDNIYQFSWDAENRLTQVETTAGALANGVPYRRIHYTYDSDSRLVQRVQYDQPVPAAAVKTTRFLHAGWRCLGELDHSGTLQKSYSWGLDNEDSLHLGDSNGALLWLHDHNSNETHLTTYDGNGNVTGLVSAQTDLPTATYTHSPFGQLLTSTGPYAEENTYRFSTKPLDPVTGFYNYGYRHLNPSTGTWLSRDPIAEDGGLNVYGFVGNDPTDAYDVYGATTARAAMRTAALWGVAWGAAEFAAQDAVDQIADNLGALNAFEEAGCSELYAEAYPNRHYNGAQTLRQAVIGGVIGGLIGRFGGPALSWVGKGIARRFPGVGRRGAQILQRAGDRPFLKAFARPRSTPPPLPRSATPPPLPAPRPPASAAPASAAPSAPPRSGAADIYDGIDFPSGDFVAPSLDRPYPHDVFRMDSRLMVEMRAALDHEPQNAAGFLRDAQFYWRQVAEDFPEAFSPQNLRIIQGLVRNPTTGRIVRMPRNDAQFRSIFRQYNLTGLRGQAMIHHHVGGGAFAAGIPVPLHRGSGGIHILESILGISFR